MWQSCTPREGACTVLVAGEFGCCVAAIDSDIRKETLTAMIYFPRVLCQGDRLFNCVKYNTEQLLSAHLPKMLMFAKGEFGISLHSFQRIKKG